MVCSFAYMANAAPPVVSGITASQRTGTKIVDITYNLTLDEEPKAFVELWFSPDNGLNFPIRCVDVTGAVDANVTAGTNKTVTWNAESDWDQQFTASGKIRVIATYGSEPSGYSGSGNGGHENGHGSGHADSSLQEVFWDQFFVPGNQAGQYEDWSNAMQGLAKMKVDPTEVTNEQWNEVAQWALSNGYTGLPMAPGSEDADKPRSGITFWQAIKWCNARSEKDGLTPAYYQDHSEADGWDVNGNGIVDTGPDTWESWSADTNGNNQWDPGEAYQDVNNNGVFDPKEYQDFNGNNQYDAGLSQVFKSDPSITFSVGGGPSPSFHNYVDHNATGYRLPSEIVFEKLATGGNSQKSWPWGNDSPAVHPDFVNEFAATRHGPSGLVGDPVTQATSADGRSENGYGLKDVIGNLAEWTEDLAETGNTPKAIVYGGSYLGLDSAAEWDGFGEPPFQYISSNGNGTSAANLFELSLKGSVTTSSPAVGLRAIRYVWAE